MNKTKLIFSLVSVIFLLSPSFGQDEDFKVINRLKFHKSVKDQQKAKTLFKIPFGTKTTELGGVFQDEKRISDGVPAAFRIYKKNIWILDNVKNALKQYSLEGKPLRSISLKGLGNRFCDFSITEEGSIWLLESQAGKAFKISQTGKLKAVIEDLKEPQKIQTGKDSVYISIPLFGSVYKFIPGLKKAYKLDKSIQISNNLSLFENSEKQLYEFDDSEVKANLYIRQGLVKGSRKLLCKLQPDVIPGNKNRKFVKKTVIGKDFKNRIYSRITVNDDFGVIYQDRIYRCKPDGSEIAHIDILPEPSFPLTPSLPRKLIVSQNGRIVGFHSDNKSFALIYYFFPN